MTQVNDIRHKGLKIDWNQCLGSADIYVVNKVYWGHQSSCRHIVYESIENEYWWSCLIWKISDCAPHSFYFQIEITINCFLLVNVLSPRYQISAEDAQEFYLYIKNVRVRAGSGYRYPKVPFNKI